MLQDAMRANDSPKPKMARMVGHYNGTMAKSPSNMSNSGRCPVQSVILCPGKKLLAQPDARNGYLEPFVVNESGANSLTKRFKSGRLTYSTDQ